MQDDASRAGGAVVRGQGSPHNLALPQPPLPSHGLSSLVLSVKRLRARHVATAAAISCHVTLSRAVADFFTSSVSKSICDRAPNWKQQPERPPTRGQTHRWSAATLTGNAAAREVGKRHPCLAGHTLCRPEAEGRPVAAQDLGVQPSQHAACPKDSGTIKKNS